MPTSPSPSPAPVARHGRLRSTRSVATLLKFVAAGLAVLLVSGVSVAAVAVFNVTSSIAPGVALSGEDKTPPQIGPIEGAVNLLLVGSDSGGGNAAYGERGEVLNDVTMLLHISADHERATVVSFPRDMFVDIPECTAPDGETFEAVSDQKMNTTLNRGGLACPVSTVEAITGLEVPYAATIEFDGVIAMSNAVGGVPVCVATAINDRQISFQLSAGEHVLSGVDALQFLRSRYGVGDGSDTTRISNQQQFLSSLVRTLKSSETLSNPLKLYGIAAAATQNLEFANRLRNVDTMVSIAAALRDIPLEEVVFVKSPSTDGHAGGQSGVLPIQPAADALFAALEADLPIGLTGTTGGGTIAESTPEPAPEPTGEPAPEASADPSADPSASPTPERVELPSAVEGQNASQVTCTAGQTSGG